MENTILVVEDDKRIIQTIYLILKEQNYNVIIAKTKREAITYIKNKKINLALLDIELPDGTGFDVCKQIKQYSDIPVIFLTGKTEEKHIVYGLDIGADDYISKPFNNNVLISRINSVLRRYYKNSSNTSIIYYRNLIIDLDKAVVIKEKEEINLTKIEYKLLIIFLKNKDKLITREQLLHKIWDIDENYVNDNTLSVYVKRLRKKIGDTSDNEIIKTVRGIGYILNK